MRKKIIFIIFSVMTSCSFIKEDNPTGLETIYNTPEMLESSIYGIISGFVDNSNGISGEPVAALSCSSGIVHWGSSGPTKYQSPDYECWLHFTQYSNCWRNVYFFRQMYVPISRVNALLEAIDNSPVEEGYKLEIAAEARFYRALAYFWIVRIWGDCPLHLYVDDENSSTYCPRTPYYEVYAQIVADLEFARKNMRAPERVRQLTPQMPRPDRYAATALLSNVYTTIGSLLASPDDNFWDNAKEGRRPDFSSIGLDHEDIALAASQAYSKALEYATELIPGSSNYDSGCRYRLLEKHSDLFEFDPAFSRNGYNSWIHPEQVFCIPSTIAGGANADFAKMALPDFPEGTSATIMNSSRGRYRPSRWAFQKWCETYPGDIGVVPTMYATSTDPRLNSTMYYSRMKYCNGGGLLTMYPAQVNTNSSETAYPYFKKYASVRYNVNDSDADIYVIRFAEMYFNAAEACAFLGDEDRARDYIEVIHSRARQSVGDGQPASTQPSWSGRVFSDKEELLTAIFWEKMFEFMGENIEYFETHRRGARWIIKNICVPKNDFLQRPNESGLLGMAYPPDWKYPEDFNSDPDVSGSDVFMVRKGLLHAFPENEFMYNSAISSTEDQNDYTY